MRNIPLLIVGGGIGGLATALAAAQSGRAVHVIEKSPSFAEIGAGLQLAPNATRVLDRLGILEDVVQGATFPRRLVMMDAITGGELTSSWLSRQVCQGQLRAVRWARLWQSETFRE